MSVCTCVSVCTGWLCWWFECGGSVGYLTVVSSFHTLARFCGKKEPDSNRCQNIQSIKTDRALVFNYDALC